MANTSPICSVSPSTDSNASSQSCLHNHASADRQQQATSSFQQTTASRGFAAAGVNFHPTYKVKVEMSICIRVMSGVDINGMFTWCSVVEQR